VIHTIGRASDCRCNFAARSHSPIDLAEDYRKVRSESFLWELHEQEANAVRVHEIALPSFSRLSALSGLNTAFSPAIYAIYIDISEM
jgi:hypothetical protein